jgi:hypothetical protein
VAPRFRRRRELDGLSRACRGGRILAESIDYARQGELAARGSATTASGPPAP